MMPITMAEINKPMLIGKIKDKGSVKTYLEKLGFIPGCEVTLVAKQNGNIICKIKESRIAINRDMAKCILINPKI
ncbi:MAG: ferrous iron transport protein A [Eubacteriaceae bacterium]|nr:ferrous iron transport protein A [Eubacteriaceae bacterium]